jgi:ABC-type multidrug transport system fused ATPase/permease subunit
MANWREMMLMMQMVRMKGVTLAGFLYRNLKGYRFWVGCALFLTMVQVGADLLYAFPLKIILDKLVSHRNPPWVGGLLDFFDRFGTAAGLRPGETHTQVSVILFALLLLAGITALSLVTTYIQNSIASVVGKNLTARLRKQLFEQLQRLSLDWHNRQKKGDIVQRIIGDIAGIERLVTDGLIEAVTGIFTIIGIVIVVFLISYQFTLLFIVIVPALFAIVFAYTKSITQAIKRAVRAAGEVANVATEDVAAIALIKGFTLEERESMRFTRYVWQDREATVQAGELQAQITPVVTGLVALGTIIILGVGAYVAAGNTFTFWFLTIPRDTLTIGALTVFLTYLSKLYQPMRSVARLTNVGINAATGAERIQEVFDQAPEINDPLVPYTGPTRLRGEITFQQVSFAYSPERPVLRGIDLHIPAGRKIGLVGLSGGGKTTLTKLIPRFYETQQGAVLIDGVDIRQYPLNMLRQNISLVLQESILFEGTIRENIALGRPDASDEEIMQAARQAAIHETIMELPDGYETRVREGGMNFSGGQRQRLAIARAILRDAPILILDEPTASLDVEAEVQVTRAIDQLVTNRTVLLISHRLSTLGNVDEIIVLAEGRIAERGSFEELKRSGGIFASFLREQNRYMVERDGAQSLMRPAQMERWEMRPTSDGEVTVRLRKRPQPVRQARMLIEVDGKKAGERELDNSKPILTIGRLMNNDIVIASPTVSRLHARLRRQGGGWLIEDAESLNGLLYQGERIELLPLSNGDQVKLAPKVILHYVEV